ncbi:hypothetical protein PVK06_022496 [Gossypium arboreum]|uniref:Protein CHUP1, chloroplastic-like n=1 Tax=Gossypium arboreum TaxID=29729 RepID=A0ABR0P8R9_GOSAR|nr:hypothetical protein PVK06_022496 [Gossypium arboreum]
MIFRVSILVVASLAAFAVSPLNTKKRLKKQHSMLSGKGCSSTQETEELGGEKFGDDISEEDMQNEEETEVVNTKNLNPNTEIEHSQSPIKELESRRLTLERKLLELHSLKEKLSCIAYLQKDLTGKTAEIGKLNFTISALKAEIKDLQEIIRQGNMGMKQLDMAKQLIEELQRKNGSGSQIKGQIILLEEQLSGFTAIETSSGDALVKSRLEDIKNIELEVIKKRRRNKELELEKREIFVKLYAAHAKLSALSYMTQNKTIGKISALRQANGDLANKVNILQKSRFDMVEELVYQRWLNVCLRAEIKEYQTSSRKTSEKEVQKASDQKTSKIITQYPDTNSTWSYTSSTDSEEIDSSTIDSSSSSQRSISKNSSTCWRSMDDGSSVVSSPNKSSIGSPADRTGIIRRFSTSMLPSKEFTETMEMPNLTKVRRVSFNADVEAVSSVKIVLAKSVEGLLDEKGIVSLVPEDRLSVKKGVVESQSALAGEKQEFPLSEASLVEPDQSSGSNRRSIDENERDARDVSWIENAQPDGELHPSISNVIRKENKMESLINPRIFAFLFFVFVLLLCFLLLSAMIYKS